MRIVIDGRMLSWTGVGRYTTRLLEYLQTLDDKNEYIVLMLPADTNLWRPTAANFSREFVRAAPYSFAEQLRLPFALYKLKPDLVHFTHFAVPLLYRAPFVVMVHDVILVEYKNYRGEGLKKMKYELKYLASRVALRHAARASRLVLTPTNYTRDRLKAMFRLDDSRITTTLLGIDKLSDTPIKATISAPFILSLGNSYPYKNLDRLVDAFAVSKFKTNGGLLVLAGQNDYFGGVLRERIQSLGLAESILFPGRVSDDESAGLFAAATLYVYPSIAEGFGLQALEAMHYDTAVLASNATCLPEVCGKAAEYFQPTDTAELTAKIDELTASKTRRDQLVAAGREQIKRFSWKAMAEKTLAAYRVAAK